MRTPLVCLIFLICILAIEAKSRWKKGKTYIKNEIYWSINSKSTCLFSVACVPIKWNKASGSMNKVKGYC